MKAMELMCSDPESVGRAMPARRSLHRDPHSRTVRRVCERWRTCGRCGWQMWTSREQRPPSTATCWTTGCAVRGHGNLSALYHLLIDEDTQRWAFVCTSFPTRCRRLDLSLSLWRWLHSIRQWHVLYFLLYISGVCMFILLYIVYIFHAVSMSCCLQHSYEVNCAWLLCRK